MQIILTCVDLSEQVSRHEGHHGRASTYQSVLRKSHTKTIGQTALSEQSIAANADTIVWILDYIQRCIEPVRAIINCS